LKKNKSELRILNITIDEIQSILESVIREFDQNAWLSGTRNSSVQSACQRRKITKTDLQRICDSLGGVVSSSLGLTVEDVSPRLIKACDGTIEHQKLMSRRFTKASALHDICALQYIKNKRGSVVRSAQKAKDWFVSPNFHLIQFNLENIDSSAIKDVVSPDELACLVWLQNPTGLGLEASKIGLNSLIAETISQALPSVQVLNDMPENLKKYSDLTQEEYAGAIGRISHMSLIEMNKIHNELSEPETAQAAILRLVDEQNELIKSTIEEKGTAIESIEMTRIKLEAMIRHEQETRRRIEEELRTLIGSEKTQAGIEQNRLAAENKILLLRDKRNRRFILLLVLIVIGFVWWFIVPSNFINHYVKPVIAWIIGLSGLWTFGNLLINLKKSME
jgi:hypothetical protein